MLSKCLELDLRCIYERTLALFLTLKKIIAATSSTTLNLVFSYFSIANKPSAKDVTFLIFCATDCKLPSCE